MKITIENLVAIEDLKENIDNILDMVETSGKAVILRKNRPAFIILPYITGAEFAGIHIENYKLHDAMQIVLIEQENHSMHAAKLADEIYNRRLYTKKDFSKAQYPQIRARAQMYNQIFEALPGNIIRLRNNNEN
jgi:antitoxin Phd